MYIIVQGDFFYSNQNYRYKRQFIGNYNSLQYQAGKSPFIQAIQSDSSFGFLCL